MYDQTDLNLKIFGLFIFFFSCSFIKFKRKALVRDPNSRGVCESSVTPPNNVIKMFVFVARISGETSAYRSHTQIGDNQHRAIVAYVMTTPL